MADRLLDGVQKRMKCCVGFDGAILKEISYEELFGTLNWPYVNGTCMDEEGNVIVAITDQREDASCYETIIFKLKGF